MSEITLFILIGTFILFLILAIYFYDKKLVKQIKSYEKRLETKGIFKRHFIKNKEKGMVINLSTLLC